MAGYDVEYLRHLPEFQHWKDPHFGKENFLHDTDLLNLESATYIPLVYLFVRSPVDQSWYDKLPVAQNIERQGELEQTIESKRRKIRQSNLINETLEADVTLHKKELLRCKERIRLCQQAQQAALRRSCHSEEGAA